MEISRPIFTLLSLLTALFSGLATFVNLYEWYNIKILSNTSDYPFGSEGPVPYYYKTATLYSTVNLVWGILFLTAFVFGGISTIKGYRKRTALAFGLTLILYIAMFIHGNINTD